MSLECGNSGLKVALPDLKSAYYPDICLKSAPRPEISPPDLKLALQEMKLPLSGLKSALI